MCVCECVYVMRVKVSVRVCVFTLARTLALFLGLLGMKCSSSSMRQTSTSEHRRRW